MTRIANVKLLTVLLAIVAAVAAMVAFQNGTVHAAYPGKHGHIAFSTNRDGDIEIYQMNADGSNPMPLTLAPFTDDRRSSYSANGKKLVYDVGDQGDRQEIYSMKANGLLQTRLTRNKVFDEDPSLSPDGKKIVFVSSRTADNSEEIFVMNADGTGVKELTDAPGASFSPTFSPDGKKIAFTTNRDGVGGSEIYIMNADGSKERRFTNSPLTDSSPDWSPDAKKIVFTTNRSGDFEIYRMKTVDANNDHQGDDPTNLTNTVGQDLGPVYSPDGKRIAFQSNRDGNGEIYVMDTDPTTNDASDLTDNPASDFEASWQPRLARR